MNRKRPNARPRRLSAWQQSAEFRMVSIAAIEGWNAKRDGLPRCGAKRKSDGQPCQQWPVRGKVRCWLHGGVTPRGKAWHTRQRASRNKRRLERKLLKHERETRKRGERFAAMTPTERESYRRWLRTHQPGLAAARAALREQRRQLKEARDLLNEAACKPRTSNAEALSLEREKAKLQRRAEKLRADIAACATVAYTGGVFD